MGKQVIKYNMSLRFDRGVLDVLLSKNLSRVLAEVSVGKERSGVRPFN